MERAEAAGVLGVAVDAAPDVVQRAYRDLIRLRHPDHAGPAANDDAARIIEAYATLRHPAPPPPPPAERTAAAGRPARSGWRWTTRPQVAMATMAPAAIVRVDDDTIGIGAPADEAFLLLMEAAHDIGEVTYVDRSVPILEALCQFVGTPATSLVVTIQGRRDGTEAFCTAESIEARPGPPTKDVVDVYEHLLRQRQAQRFGS